MSIKLGPKPEERRFKSSPRNQQDYTDTAIFLDGGFLLLRYSEFQSVYAFFTEEFEDFLRGVGAFFKVILMSLIEVQNVFLMINFDVWDRLRHI